MLGRTLLVGTAAYVTLAFMLRVMAKHTLAKLNAFDLVNTVALGSLLTSGLASHDVARAQRALTFVLLAVRQFAVTWLSVRSAAERRKVRSEPALRLNCSEPRDDPCVVVLETDGSFSFVPAMVP